MSSTIDDFRNFFKPNKSKEKFNIFKIVDEVLNVLSFDLRYKNIKVTKVGDNFSLYLFKNEFKQVLLNLLNNAKDEILKRGQNYIGEVDIKCYMKDNKKIIIIEDNAGGVPKEIINRIFEPYFTTKEQTQGTGIGLYMSKMIIEKNMNGTLDVSNTERGAKFSIIFDIGMED
jgi:signal transduction histidine kinase